MFIKAENLKRLFKKQDIPHAILFEGVSDKERLDAAILLAKIISCNKKTAPCNKCVDCIKIEKNIHPDIKIISKGESASIKIEQIRDLRLQIHVIPNESIHKIFIIQNADLMTVQAQNAFIKILEEPPKNVIFILICNCSYSLLETVRSRTQIYVLESTCKHSNQNKEALEISKNLVSASKNNNKAQILKNLSKIPNNKIFLKDVLENFLNIFIKECSSQENVLEKLESIKYILNLIDKNVNFNMIVSFLCVSL